YLLVSWLWFWLVSKTLVEMHTVTASLAWGFNIIEPVIADHDGSLGCSADDFTAQRIRPRTWFWRIIFHQRNQLHAINDQVAGADLALLPIPGSVGYNPHLLSSGQLGVGRRTG